MDVPNQRGVTPLTMLQTNADSLWVGSKVAEKIKEHMLATTRKNIFRRLMYDKV